jgi:hypothetical protein
MKLDDRDASLGRMLERSLEGVGHPTPPEPTSLMRRGTRRRSVVLVASLATVAAFIGAASFAASRFGEAFDQAVSPSSAERTPLRFLPSHGWESRAYARNSTTDDVSAAWASNQPIDADDEMPIYPYDSISSLPDDGIFIHAWEELPGEAPDPTNPDFPVSQLPLEVPDEVTARWEGSIPGIGRSSLLAQVGGRYLRIDIYYGTTDPPEELRSEAQVALSRLVVEPRLDPRIYTDEADGVSLTVLPGWSVTPEPINTWVSSPREILALATYPLRPGGDAVTDFQLPSNAIDDLGPNDMLIWINEAGSGSGFPSRPDRFEPSTPCEGWNKLCPEPTGTEVWSGFDHPPDVRGWWLGFNDTGRGFYVFVGMGEKAFADPDRAPQAWAILDSLTFASA